jgi:hypothetical protein
MTQSEEGSTFFTCCKVRAAWAGKAAILVLFEMEDILDSNIERRKTIARLFVREMKLLLIYSWPDTLTAKRSRQYVVMNVGQLEWDNVQ